MGRRDTVGEGACASGVAAAPSAAAVQAAAGSAAPSAASRSERRAAASLVTFHEPPARFGANRRLMLAGIIALAALLVGVLVGGNLVSGAAMATDFTAKNLAPGPAHPFGTDWMGRDMLLRTFAGLSTSVFVGLLAAACSSVIALALAVVAALGGPVADAVVCWVIDLVMGIPHIVLLILVSYALGRGFWGVTIAVALTHWTSLARVLRAEILQLRGQPYVLQARALGVGAWRLVGNHMLPALVPQLVVGLVLMFPHAILHEASITFLGFGLGAGQPAIGVILSEAMSYLSAGCWWLAVFPGCALLAVVLAFDRLGALLRHLVDARSVQE